MIKEKINKKTIVLLILFLILGFIVGIIVSESMNINCKEENTEIRILNKEINNCIDKLNQQTQINNIKDVNFN
jgi:preprotein translocase subunit SecG